MDLERPDKADEDIHTNTGACVRVYKSSRLPCRAVPNPCIHTNLPNCQCYLIKLSLKYNSAHFFFLEMNSTRRVKMLTHNFSKAIYTTLEITVQALSDFILIIGNG